MCGRFTLTAAEHVILDLFEIQTLPPQTARYNVAPTQDVLAVRTGEDAREAAMLRWGLIPHWAKDKAIGSRMINARAETVAEKPAYREAFAQRRCLVVADGFIEWQRQGKKKQPFHIRLRSGLPFGFAGLWDRWRDEDGQWLQTCTVLTTEPNDLVAPVHDRMPVIVPQNAHERWLDPSSDRGSLKELFAPFPSDLMESVAVSTRVNSVAHDDPSCLDAVEVQGALF